MNIKEHFESFAAGHRLFWLNMIVCSPIFNKDSVFYLVFITKDFFLFLSKKSNKVIELFRY